jgi:hypothetical protein
MSWKFTSAYDQPCVPRNQLCLFPQIHNVSHKSHTEDGKSWAIPLRTARLKLQHSAIAYHCQLMGSDSKFLTASVTSVKLSMRQIHLRSHIFQSTSSFVCLLHVPRLIKSVVQAPMLQTFLHLFLRTLPLQFLHVSCVADFAHNDLLWTTYNFHLYTYNFMQLYIAESCDLRVASLRRPSVFCIAINSYRFRNTAFLMELAHPQPNTVTQ